MREIKFRGRRITDGTWTYGDLIHSFDLVYVGDEYQFLKENIVVTASIGQYTGLLDKNGKEIYEGDILRVFEYYCEEEPDLNEWKDVVVEWDEDGSCLAIEWDYGDYDITAIGWALQNLDNSGCRVEIIGNIHENGGLINGE